MTFTACSEARPADTVHHLAASRALMWLFYNRSADEAMRMAYGDSPGLHPSYLADKEALWKRSPLTFLSQLDAANSVRFWRRCMDIYADDAYDSARRAVAGTLEGAPS